MCCCHKGENNGACNRGCKDCLVYSKCFLMQLSVALGLHFGCGSQLNTSEMFWIDISRWMISSRCSWISVYLFWHSAHAFEPLPFFCSIVLPAKTHRRAATSNTKSREAPRTAGGPWSLGQRPANSGTRPGYCKGVQPDLYLVSKVMDCFD